MKKIVYKLFLVIITALILSFCSTDKIKAATIYVNYTSGNDTTGNGSADTPYKTFHKGYTMASTNDTLNLTGTFDWSNADETGDATTTGYTIAKAITITGQRADQTIIQADSTPNTANKRVFTLNSAVTLQNLTIRYAYHNIAGYSGTAIYTGSSLTIINCVIDQNKNHADRYVNGAIYAGGNFIMRGSTVSNNENGYAGGLYLSGTNVEITNSTFYNNVGDYYGGVYFSNGGTLTLTNSTLVNNKSNYGFGGNLSIWYDTLYMKNTILADSAGGVNFYRGGGTVYDNGYNIVESQTYSDFVNGVNGNLVGNQVNLNIDSGLALNDTTTGVPNLALLTGSVAINSADPLDTANNGVTVPTTDQRGMYRNGVTDIGTYEYGGALSFDQPTVQAQLISFSSVNYNQMTINWTNGDGTKRIVFIKQTSTGTASPVDNSTYTANTIFGSGTQIGSSGWYAIYNGTGTSVTVTGLTQSTDYIVQAFEYNGGVGSENYFTTTSSNNPNVQTTSVLPEPTSQAISITFSSIQYTQMTMDWINGNGTKRVIFMKEANTGTALPVDNINYLANTIFGSGTQIGSSGWYAIYNSTGTSVTVTGLTPQTDYIVQVFEYNDSGSSYNYLLDTASNNPKSQTTATVTEPTIQASSLTFSSVSNSQMIIDWTNGDGNGRAVFIKQGASGTATPIDNTSYTANTVFGSGTQIGSSGWYAIYNSTGTSVTVTGLTASTTYIVQVFEYNLSGATVNYLNNTGIDNPNTQTTSAAPSSVTLGSGTSTTGSSEASPINIWYRSLHGQSVYTTAELNTAGVTGPIYITQIGFYVNSIPIYALPNFVIRMKHTTDTTVANWQTSSGMTTVYSTASYTPTAGGFDMKTLSAPFTWNGVDNIVVDTAFSQVLPTYNQSGIVRYYSSTSGYRYARSDSSDQTNIFTGGSTSSSKPQLKLTLLAIDSTPPTIDSISADKANGSYKVGEIIDIDVTFSEAVTSTGNITVTLDTGRTCTFTVSNSTVGTCNYTVSAGDTSLDLDATISGIIADQSSNLMVNYAPSTTLATNKSLVIDTTSPSVNAGLDQSKNSQFTQDATSSDLTSGIASYQWSKQSGSGVIIFGSETSEDTTVSASVDDIYVIRLTATDNAGNSAYDEFSLIWSTITPGTTTPVSIPLTNSSAPVCNDKPPVGTPDLFQIDRINNSAVLYFTPVNPASEYVISYGSNTNDSQFSGTFTKYQTEGVVTLTVSELSPDTIYTFKVRGGNGCTTGNWSNSKTAIHIANSVSPPNKCSYIIKANDTLWKISKEMLGQGSLYKEIIEKNIEIYPEIESKLKIGTVLIIPCEKDEQKTVINEDTQKNVNNSKPTNKLAISLILIIAGITYLITRIPIRKRRIMIRKIRKILLG